MARFKKCGLESEPDPDTFPHGGGLAFGYAGGAFFHEKDFHCGEDDFDIFDQAGSGYIHEIYQEFIIGGCTDHRPEHNP